MPFSTEQSAKLFRLGISEQRVPLSRNLALAIDLSDCPKRLDPALRRTACANLRISFTPELSIYRFLSDVDPLKTRGNPADAAMWKKKRNAVYLGVLLAGMMKALFATGRRSHPYNGQC